MPRRPAQPDRIARGTRLSDLLVEGRKVANMTQRDLAQLSGVNLDTIRHIEQGSVHEPGFFTVADLADASHLDLAEVARQTRSRRSSRNRTVPPR